MFALNYPLGFEAELLEADPYVDFVLCACARNLCLNIRLASEVPKELGGLLLILSPIHR